MLDVDDWAGVADARADCKAAWPPMAAPPKAGGANGPRLRNISKSSSCMYAEKLIGVVRGAASSAVAWADRSTCGSKSFKDSMLRNAS